MSIQTPISGCKYRTKQSQKLRVYGTLLVAGSHTTGFEYIPYVSAVDGNRVVVCGNVGEEWRITQFSLIHGGKLRSTVLNEKPNGLASITLGEKAYLAVSYL